MKFPFGTFNPTSLQTIAAAPPFPCEHFVVLLLSFYSYFYILQIHPNKHLGNSLWVCISLRIINTEVSFWHHIFYLIWQMILKLQKLTPYSMFMFMLCCLTTQSSLFTAHLLSHSIYGQHLNYQHRIRIISLRVSDIVLTFYHFNGALSNKHKQYVSTAKCFSLTD